MSQTFNVGDRVVCIPFKHKGKVATVRFFGTIGKKFGTWVGLELDEPTGECSGDFNGEYLFECAENFGLILRNTQVKLFDPNEASNRADGGANEGREEQPQISPNNATQPKPQLPNDEEETKQGWREKLEKLRAKKMEEKNKPKDAPYEDPNVDKVRSAFGQATGIRRNEEGQLEVSQSEALKSTSIAERAIAAAMAKAEEPPIEKSKSTVKKPTLNMADVETPLDKEVKPTAKDRLEQTRQAAVDKKKELEAKNTTVTQSRLARPTLTPRSGSNTRGFTSTTTEKPATTAPTATSSAASVSNLRNQSNLKGTTPVPTKSKIASANAYNAEEEKKKPEEKRPAMTQPTVDNRLKREGSTSRLAAPSSTLAAKVEPTKKVPTGTVATASTGKTPLKQAVTNNLTGALNKSIVTKVGASESNLNKSIVKPVDKPLEKPAITPSAGAISTFTKAQIAQFEGQLEEKEAEISKLQQEIETHKQKIGSMMIKHTSELKRQNQEIELLKKQVESASSSQTGDELMQEQINAAQALLEEAKEAEASAQARISDLEEEVSQIRQQLSEARIEVTHEKNNTAVKIADYESQLDELRKQQDSSNKNSSAAKQQAEADLQSKLEAVKKEMSAQLDMQAFKLEKAYKEIEKLKKEVKEEQERREEEVEILKLEKDALADEKQDILDRMMESAQVEEDDPLKDLGLEEIKIQNKRLRQAITTLTFGFEEEKKAIEQRLQNNTEKDKIIADQDARLKEMDLLLDELEKKETELAEMKERYDEIIGYEQMVEEMVQEIANKEGEVEEMQERMIEIEEEHAMLEELVENLEKYNKELQDDLATKDKEIEGINAEKEQLETIVIDQDAITQKYKDRGAQLTNQISILTEQLQSAVSQTGNRDQVTMLLEKQQVLISKLRDTAKKSLDVSKERIASNQLRMRADVVQQMLPESLAEEALLPSLEKISNLNITKHKATLLVRQICENVLDNAKNVYEDEEQREAYLQTLLKICLMSHKIIDCAGTVQFQVANMTVGQYEEITKLLVWQQIRTVSVELDSVLELLLDEAIGQNFDATSLEQALAQMENLKNRVEATFVRISPEEQKEQEMSGKTEANPSIEQQRRKNLAKVCQKLSYRSSALQMALSVTFVPHLQSKFETAEDRQQMQQKVNLIYTRLMQTVLRIDMIDGRQTGEEFFDEKLNSDLRMQQKFETLKPLWEGSSMSRAEAQKKNCQSIIEAVERDITQLMNDYKFKKLVHMIEEKYGDKKIDLNDLYAVDFQASGPWRTIAQSIRADLQDMGVLKQKNSQLIEQHKQVSFQILQLKKEKEENTKVTQTLETKLGQALAKAEQLNALELERDEQNKVIQNLKRKLESEQKEHTTNRASLDDFKKKLEDAKKTIAEKEKEKEKAVEQPTQQIQNQPQKGGSRRQHAKDFFAGFQNPGQRELQRQGSISGGNSAAIIQSATASEDMYLNIINDLQADRMRMRGKDMTARLKTLQSDDSAFAKLINQSRTSKISQAQTVSLNTEEQSKIETALNSVDTLKSNFKRQMANARIVDLTKVQEHNGTTGNRITPLDVEKAVAEHQKRNTEQFNFLVVEARNRMNDALEFLFQKDSKLRNLQQQTRTTALQPHAEADEAAKPASEMGEVKIGCLKLKGKIAIPNRKVILDETALAELRRNVQLLTL